MTFITSFPLFRNRDLFKRHSVQSNGRAFSMKPLNVHLFSNVVNFS